MNKEVYLLFQRKFVVEEADLKEMLIALMEHTMNFRDSIGNQSWYNVNFYKTIQDFYPEQISIDEIRENNIDFQECADAIIEAGKYQEIANMEEINSMLTSIAEQINF